MLLGYGKADLLLRKADTARDNRNWQEAATWYQRYIRSKPDDAAIWIQLGHARKESGDLDGAESAYLRGLALATQSADAHLQIGHLYNLKGDLRRASTHYRRSYELDPQTPFAATALSALGENLEPGMSIDDSLALDERVDRLDAEFAKHRAANETLFRSLNDFLTNAASLQAFGFRLSDLDQRLHARLDEMTAWLTTLREAEVGHDDVSMRMRLVDDQMMKLLGFVSESRALGFTLAGATKRLDVIEAWREATEPRVCDVEDLAARLQVVASDLAVVSAKLTDTRAEASEWHSAMTAEQVQRKGITGRLDALAAQVAHLTDKDAAADVYRGKADTGLLKAQSAIAAIASGQATSEKDFEAWRSSVEKRLEEMAQAPMRLAALSEEMSEKVREANDTRAAALAQALSRARADIAALATRLSALPEPTTLDTSALVRLLKDPSAADALPAALAPHFASAEALRTQEGRIATVEAVTARFDQGFLAQLSDAASKAALMDERWQRADDYWQRVDAMLAYLLGRVEFVRREMMFEFHHGRSKPDLSALEIETRVISVDKFKLQSDSPRLNLGCGHILIDAYLNVDRRELPGVDILAEVDKLPYQPGEVAEMRLAHLLEHFPQELLRRSLLPYWHDLLKPGGMFVAIVPDAAEMIAASARGEYGFNNFREVFFGAQDYVGDFHFNMFTPESLSDLLVEAGFVGVKILDRARRNGACFEFEVCARRASARGLPMKSAKRQGG